MLEIGCVQPLLRHQLFILSELPFLPDLFFCKLINTFDPVVRSLSNLLTTSSSCLIVILTEFKVEAGFMLYRKTPSAPDPEIVKYHCVCETCMCVCD